MKITLLWKNSVTGLQGLIDNMNRAVFRVGLKEVNQQKQADLQIAIDRLHDTSDPIISIGEMRSELNV